jgi:hypothetical protein
MLSCVLYGQDYDPPDGYYDNASGLTGTALRNAVYEIINDHTWYPYTSGSTDTWIFSTVQIKIQTIRAIF